MNWETAKAAHIGGREEQQDRAEVLVSEDRCLLVLADGMGGHRDGAMAAQAVVDAAREAWRDRAPAGNDPAAFLPDICLDAHGRINALDGDPEQSPRSTCVLFYAEAGEAHWLSVGDSRFYHFRKGKLISRTRDHSVVQMLVDIGKIAEEEMGRHPDQNRLLQSLGGADEPEPETGAGAVRDGDGFLLCSDGVWECVETAEMGKALNGSSLESAAEALVRNAAARGGSGGDNVTVALARPSGRRTGSRRTVVGLAIFAAALAIAVSAWLVLFRPASPGAGNDQAGSIRLDIGGIGGNAKPWTVAPSSGDQGKGGPEWRDPDRTE